MGTSSALDSLIISMKAQLNGAASSTRLQAPVRSTWLGLTPTLSSENKKSDIFGDVTSRQDELRQGMSRKIGPADKEAQTGQDALSGETARMRSQVRNEQAVLTQITARETK